MGLTVTNQQFGRPDAPTTLQASLLGELQVRIDGVSVAGWPGRRGVSVLRFVLCKRRLACTRDELLEEFWPGVSPARARNRLQVAVSSVRRSLLGVTTRPVLTFRLDEYRIADGIHVDLDVTRFDAALASATVAERAGAGERARGALREAARLYRDDFAVDAPFEDWTMLPRENYRLRLLNALDRLSRLDRAAGDLDACIATNLQILQADPCREDAHRELMRCYADQERPSQVLRQYRFCERILSSTLGVEPDERTRSVLARVARGREVHDLPARTWVRAGPRSG